jgi:manganese-dependent inorganic pyrophosphatase
MNETIHVIGHKNPDTDSICSAIAYAFLRNALGDTEVRPARAGWLNPETRYVLERFSLPEPELLASATGQRLILVDHNEVAQALDDIRHGNVLEVWEHHRIGDLQIPSPITFHCEPVGATATLIAEQFFLHEIAPPPAIAGALLAAILSDTLVLASPTTSNKDRRMAPKLAALAGVDVSEFGAELMAARGNIATRSARDLIEADFKAFNFSGHRVGIGQVEVPDASPLVQRHTELLAAMKQVREEQKLQLVLFIGTDITRKGSHVWAVGDHRDVVGQAFHCQFSEEGVFLEGCMSRKKQIVPVLETALSPHCGGSSGK